MKIIRSTNSNERMRGASDPSGDAAETRASLRWCQDTRVDISLATGDSLIMILSLSSDVCVLTA